MTHTLRHRLAMFGLVAVSLVGISSCAGNLPNADALEQDGFSLLADSGQEPGFHQGGHGGPGGHFGGPMLGMFVKELNLTAEQQAQFKALFAQARAENQGLRPDFKAVRDAIKAAFLSESFDAAALSAQLQQKLPAPGSHAPQMATKLIKAWQILTPEQQAKVVARLEQMEARMQQFQQNPAAAMHRQEGPGRQLLQLARQLQLSADQQARLKAIWTTNKPERQNRMEQLRSLKQQVLTELRSGTPSADRIAALIAPLAQQGHQGLGKQLEKLAAVHDILTSAQRQQLVSLMEAKAKEHRGHWGHK
ncbi:MAG: periplasmic heavy metal sensor [Candidatus Sericytochromatia bacterium]